MKRDRFDVAAVGECLLDVAASARGKRFVMTGFPGGAVVNALAAASKLGLHTAYLGKLSSDKAGEFLMRTIRRCGIDTAGVIVSESVPTTLAMVSLDDKGDRSFSFYRSGTSDVSYCEQEIDYNVINSCGIFHFGSVSLTDEPSRSATFAAVEYAKSRGKIISFDPNLRERLWKDLSDAKAQIERGLELADIVKLSDGELRFISGQKDDDKAAFALMAEKGIGLLALTLGAGGAKLYCGGVSVYEKAPEVKAVDTTGAGDAFLGAMLYKLVRSGADYASISEGELEKLVKFAVTAASLSVTKAGAIPSLAGRAAIALKLRELERRGQ